MKRIKLYSAFLIGVFILASLQSLLVPKYMERSPEGSLIGEYYDNAGSNDVIFIGDCEVYENFSPITLWKEYGIPSYIRGSAQQTIWQSYYLLEEILRYETPKVIVFNVLSMQYDTPESTGRDSQREAYNLMTLDGMRWSVSKWNAIQESLTAEEQLHGGILTYLFPILRYHSRWNELTQEDLTYWLHKEPISHNGYLMQTGVKPYQDPYVEPPLADERFGENSWRYLEKMRLLCEKHDVQLVLIKAPSLSPIWWPQWDAQVKTYATTHGLLYINLLQYQQQIGLDWQTDTYDGGLHLNVFGAEKASIWFGRILKDQCDLPDHRYDAALCQVWEQKCVNYENQKKESGI